MSFAKYLMCQRLIFDEQLQAKDRYVATPFSFFEG